MPPIVDFGGGGGKCISAISANRKISDGIFLERLGNDKGLSFQIRSSRIPVAWRCFRTPRERTDFAKFHIDTFRRRVRCSDKGLPVNCTGSPDGHTVNGGSWQGRRSGRWLEVGGFSAEAGGLAVVKHWPE